MHILPNILQSKGNQTMKFGRKKIIFLQKSYKKCDRETSARPLFFLKKKTKLYQVKAKGSHLSLNIFR